jgi:hypothetical protein
MCVWSLSRRVDVADAGCDVLRCSLSGVSRCNRVSDVVSGSVQSPSMCVCRDASELMWLEAGAGCDEVFVVRY